MATLKTFSVTLCGIRFITHFENVWSYIFTSEITSDGSCHNNQVKSQWYLVTILSTDNTQDVRGVRGWGRRSEWTANSHSTTNGGRKIEGLSPRTTLRRWKANPTDVNNLVLGVSQKTHIPLSIL